MTDDDSRPPVLLRMRSTVAQPRPLSSDTPAELLDADGQLNLLAMHDEMEHASSGGSMMRRVTSKTWLSSSRTGGGSVHGGSVHGGGSLHGAAAAAALAASPLLEAGVDEQDCSCARPLTATAALLPGLPRPLHQLAVACRTRDVRLLQQQLSGELLGAASVMSAALDACGNTALHMLLLPDVVSMSRQDASTHGAVGPAGRAFTPKHVGAGPGPGPGPGSCFASCFCGGGGDDGVDAGRGVDASSFSDDDGEYDADSSRTSSRNGAAVTMGGSSSRPPGADSSSNPALHRGRSLRSPSSRALASASTAAAMLSLLLSAGARPGARNAHGITPLMIAARSVAAAATSSTAATTATTTNASTATPRDGSGSTSSQAGAVALRSLQTLCASEAPGDANTRDAFGRTALMHLLLLPSSSGGGGRAAGAAGSDEESKKAPSDAHPHVSPAKQQLLSPPSHHALSSSAARAAQLRALQVLVGIGVDVNVADAEGLTPLMVTAGRPDASSELLDALLSRGANPRTVDSNRRSALAHAVAAQRLELRPALVDSISAASAAGAAGAGAAGAGAGAAAAAAASDGGGGEQPLPGHGSVIRVLCQYGALDLHPRSINTHYPDVHGFTQLHIALRRGDLHALELLLHAGADPGARDEDGNTPLHHWPTAQQQQPETLLLVLLQALLSRGADPNAVNDNGLCPLDFATLPDGNGGNTVKPGCQAVHTLLQENGARNSDTLLQPPACANDTERTGSMVLRSMRALSLLVVPRSLVPSAAAEVEAGRDKEDPAASPAAAAVASPAVSS